jgi:hypothetical protein
MKLRTFGFTLILAGLLLSLASGAAVLAATSIATPTPSQCFKTGTPVTIAWSADDAGYDNHAHLSSPSGGLSIHPATSPYTWNQSLATGSYSVTVNAHNSSHSTISSLARSFDVDASAPTAPTLSNTSKTSSSVTLSWTASTDAGCKGLAGYKIFRDGAQVTTTTGTSYTDAGRSAGTAYTYKIQAYDDFASADSNTLAVTTNSASNPSPTTPPPTASPNPGTSPTTPPASPTTPPTAGDTPTSSDSQPTSSTTAKGQANTESNTAKPAGNNSTLVLAASGGGIFVLLGIGGVIWALRRPKLQIPKPPASPTPPVSPSNPPPQPPTAPPPTGV